MIRRVVFMGTPDFAVPSLKAIHSAGHTIAGVYSKPDSPAGRGRGLTPPPIKEAALQLGLPVYQPQSLRSSEVLKELAALAPEVIVVAAYAQLLPQSVLSLPKFGCKNIHASLLPKYRGGAPIHWAIVNGESETGITIMQMARGLDTGDMILQERIPIHINQTCGDIFNELADLGAKLILEVLSLGDLGESQRIEQNDPDSSYARNVTKEDARLDFNNSALGIHNQVRGFNPWPGAFTTVNGNYLRILQSSLSEEPFVLAPGLVEMRADKVFVGCSDTCLEIQAVQPAGKKIMSAADFLRGYNNKELGTRLFFAT
ncbi:MAG: methionyl-tRNA formyltransferase [Bacillota bacterium]|nr:methionyl-tRNA formyltransferase [Bacillota bacterium]